MPAPFSEAELAELESFVEDSLVDLCTVEYVSGQASDSQGGQVDTWADRTTRVPCRIRPLGDDGPESVIADRLAGAVGWIVILPGDQTVTVRDRIVLTHQGARHTPVTPNRRFEVKAVPGDRSFKGGLEVACVELLPV